MHRIFFALGLLLPLAARAQQSSSTTTLPTASSALPAPDRLQSIEGRLAQLEGAPLKASLSEFNPAMGMALDMAYIHSDGLGAFQWRSAELNVEAPIDPFLKGWAVFTGTNGSVPTTAGGTPTIDVEEATLETTSLKNVTVRGGRLFASFGRLAHFHDHELPVVDRPLSLDTFVGGETRADGLEVSYLLPTDLYANVLVGAYDKMGTANTRADPAGSRALEEFTYLGRLSTYFDLGADHGLDVAVDSAWTPQRGAADGTRADTWRALSDVNLTYRYQPSRGGLYRGLLWDTAVLLNNEQRFSPASLPAGRVKAYSGYSVLQFKAGLRWRPGLLIDVAEDLDTPRLVTRSYSAFLTYDVTEFERLRMVYSRRHNNLPGVPGSDIVSLQWTGVLGHHVHGFRDR